MNQFQKQNFEAEFDRSRHIAPTRVRRPYLLRLLAESLKLAEKVQVIRYPGSVKIQAEAERLVRRAKSALDQEARFESERQNSKLKV